MANWSGEANGKNGNVTGPFYIYNKIKVERTDYDTKCKIKVYCYAVSTVGTSDMIRGKASSYSNGDYGSASDRKSISKGGTVLCQTGEFEVTRGTTDKTIRCWTRIDFDSTIYYVGNWDNASLVVTIPAVKKYTITYHSNGSTSAPSPQTKYHGTNVTLSNDVPETPIGYHFSKWNTESDGSGTDYNSGATYTENKDVVLYAQWVPNTYNIYYYNNDIENGQTETAPIIETIAYDQEWSMHVGLAPRIEYNFLKWNTKRDGTGTSYNASTPMGAYKKTSDSVYYAIWTLKKYSINYYANPSTDSSIKNIPEKQTKTHGINIDLSNFTPTRKGYDFTYWAFNKNGGTPTYAKGATYTNDKALSLYTTWTPVYCSVNYDANVPDDNPHEAVPETMPSAANVQRDLKWYIENKTPVREYHTFEGWHITRDITDTAYYPNGIGPIITANTTLYADWSRDQYSVIYNANGGTTAPSNITESCGNSVIISGEASRDSISKPYAVRFVVTASVNNEIVGNFSDNSTAPRILWGYATTTYSLNNWNTKKDGTGTSYNVQASYQGTKDSTLLLYAQWNTYEPRPTYPSITLPEIGTVENYVFKGWYRQGNQAPTVSPGVTGSFTLDEDYQYRENNAITTLYARWIPTTYTVEYSTAEFEDGVVENMPAPSSQIYRLSDNYTIPTTIPSFNFYENEETNKTYTVTYDYQNGKNTIKKMVGGKKRAFLGWKNNGDISDNPNPLYVKDEVYNPLTTTAGWTVSLLAHWGSEIDGAELPEMPQREGYTFGGWFKDLNYVDQIEIDNETGLIPPNEDRSDIVVYAKWTPWICRVQYSGLSQYNVQEWPYINKAEITITEEIPQKAPVVETYKVYREGNRTNPYEGFEAVSNFSFNNWVAKLNDTDIIYNSNQSISNAFNAEGGAIALYDEITNDFKGYQLNLVPSWNVTSTVPTLSFPEIEDDNIASWEIYKVWQDVNTNEWQEEKLITVDKNIKTYTPPADSDIAIYAVSKPDEWSITYNANGGFFDENEDTTSIIDNTSPNTILDNLILNRTNFEPTYTVIIHNEQDRITPIKEQTLTPCYTYTFNNWNTINDGSGIEYESGDSYTNRKNITLYAQWNEFLEEEGSDTISLETSLIEGYNFGGWYSDSRFNNLISSELSFDYPVTKSLDIYAKWTKKNYQIEYDINGGKIKTCPASQTKIYNQDITLSNRTPVYLDHIFIGWRSEINFEPLIKEIGGNSVQLNIYYALSDVEELIDPAADSANWNWTTTIPEPQEDAPYLWGKVAIIWPNEQQITNTAIAYIGNQYHCEIIEEYGLINVQDPGAITSWTTERPILTNNMHLYERVSIKWLTDILWPKDTYSWNRSMTLIAQWREIKTLTEWLSNWENTVASENAAGNEIVLWDGSGETHQYLNSSQLLNALYRLNNTNSYVYGEGYKLKLDLINPYGDIDDNNNVEKLSRTIFVPAKKEIINGEEKFSGYYELPAGVKVAEISMFDGAQASILYQAHMNLDYVDANTPDFYEVVEQVAGQISGLQTLNQNITTLLKTKYYAKDTNGNIAYEYSLDSWNLYSIEGPNGVEFEISTINNPSLTTYQLDSKGLFVKSTANGNKLYLDKEEQINHCILKGIFDIETNKYIISENITNKLFINYRANIVQRVYI